MRREEEVMFPHCSEKLLENVGENMSVFVCSVWESVIDVCCFGANNASYELGAARREGTRRSTTSNIHEIIKTFYNVECQIVIVET